MSTSKQGYNGARAKILRALANDGMLTVNEIADQSGLTPKQVLDNANQARVSGLVKSGRDDVTKLLGYQITDAGREWLVAGSSARTICASTVKESLIVVAEEAPTAEESSVVSAEEAPAIEQEDAVNESSTTADAGQSESIEQEESHGQYVIFGPGMEQPWQGVGKTLEEAKQRCVEIAEMSGIPVTLFCLVPVGQTKTTVTFIEND